MRNKGIREHRGLIIMEFRILCEECGKKSRTRSLRRCKNKLLCYVCSCPKIKKILAFPQLPKSRYKPRKRVFKEKDRSHVLPGIKSIKPKKRDKFFVANLTLEEKQFLYQKYIKNGFSSNYANSKVKEICSMLLNLSKSLREKGKSDEEIQKRFLAELERYANEEIK